MPRRILVRTSLSRMAAGQGLVSPSSKARRGWVAIRNAMPPKLTAVTQSLRDEVCPLAGDPWGPPGEAPDDWHDVGVEDAGGCPGASHLDSVWVVHGPAVHVVAQDEFGENARVPWDMIYDAVIAPEMDEVNGKPGRPGSWPGAHGAAEAQ